MQVKVNNTVSHKTSQGDVLVTKGKLVLILDTTGRFGYKGGYPHIISETEKIEVGDNYLSNKNTIELYQASLPEYHYRNAKKILALPEHFSPKHLQAIVDGKMKDSDEVYVECEQINTSNKRKANQHWEMAGLARQDGDIKDAKRHTELARQYERGENYIQIKLNSDNHITLHKVERHQILLTDSQLELFRSGNVKHNEDGSIEYYYPFTILEKNGKFYIKILISH